MVIAKLIVPCVSKKGDAWYPPVVPYVRRGAIGIQPSRDNSKERNWPRYIPTAIAHTLRFGGHFASDAIGYELVRSLKLAS